MRQTIDKHEGSKYVRTVWGVKDGLMTVDPKLNRVGIQVDVYAILEAYRSDNPAIDHALKKLLCPGVRGKGSRVEDLVGVLAAVNRAIELEEIRDRTGEPPTTLPMSEWKGQRIESCGGPPGGAGTCDCDPLGTCPWRDTSKVEVTADGGLRLRGEATVNDILEMRDELHKMGVFDSGAASSLREPGFSFRAREEAVKGTGAEEDDEDDRFDGDSDLDDEEPPVPEDCVRIYKPQPGDQIKDPETGEVYVIGDGGKVYYRDGEKAGQGVDYPPKVCREFVVPSPTTMPDRRPVITRPADGVLHHLFRSDTVTSEEVQ